MNIFRSRTTFSSSKSIGIQIINRKCSHSLIVKPATRAYSAIHSLFSDVEQSVRWFFTCYQNLDKFVAPSPNPGISFEWNLLVSTVAFCHVSSLSQILWSNNRSSTMMYCRTSVNISIKLRMKVSVTAPVDTRIRIRQGKTFSFMQDVTHVAFFYLYDIYLWFEIETDVLARLFSDFTFWFHLSWICRLDKLFRNSDQWNLLFIKCSEISFQYFFGKSLRSNCCS